MSVHLATVLPESSGALPEAGTHLTMSEGVTILSLFSLGVGLIEYARTSGQRGSTFLKVGGAGLATAVSLELPNFIASLPDVYEQLGTQHPSEQR